VGAGGEESGQKREEEGSAKQAKKEALCAQAEALASSSDWEAGLAEVKRLQAEWKSVGAVKKARSEALWQRFRTGCDAFYERYKRRDSIAREAQRAAREALCAELEALVPSGGPEAIPDLADKGQTLAAPWRHARPPATEDAALQTRLR